MNISATNVTFGTRFQLVNAETFNQKVKGLNPKKYEIAYPWTPDTMKKGKKLFTTKIMECITGGVIDGNKITGFHLGIRNQSNAKRTHQKGFDIKNFERRLLENIDTKSDSLHGFIIGGFHSGKSCIHNFKTLQKIKNVFKRNEIPFSILGSRRDVHYFGRFSWLFDGKEDTVYISNTLSKFDKSKPLSQQNMHIDGDKVHYNFYQTSQDKYGGTQYTKIRKIENQERYFNDEFEEVALANGDSFSS